MQDFDGSIRACKSMAELERVRVEVFGKKGFLTTAFAELKSLEGDKKKEQAAKLNALRDTLSELIEEKKSQLEQAEIDVAMRASAVDVSMFKQNSQAGALHPVMAVMDKIIEYFISQNFALETGPLIEDDFHNFEALNLPSYHPARDMQDTFYLKDFRVLRTHTSPVQIRTMLSQKPPIRMIAPGTVFRRDFDLTHTPMFHQVEGLVVQGAAEVSFSNLKHMLEGFLKHMFGDIRVRFRPSFFPFTEPSAEADISCIFCGGDGCRVCKHTGWLEVLGCGVVDPNVFKAVGYKDVSGYAFGLGVERFAMLLHRVPDLRSLFEGDLRLLEQFR
ncbi:phenylalanine--tRNA ligase subunit alpha [Campylobacter sp. 19-13652]|uniref:phenylalanine--tRNA ligase subunit alpha n=1 Tax=Campylobacter sp. 19-13652 TaxID=2840180 RepID=UPI001C75C03B|nr:phenylalanine--tRNA ligase subunit alpha [Campylobacter sp. 19-13652]BCX78981.1 phenylalanine--tRNA ligase alpha subunit [Campylobacter sp. 19-13652]